MTNLEATLEANRAAVDDLITAMNHSADGWTTPLAPGKWSPAQLVEHVARTLDEGAKLVAGDPSIFPTIPSFLRPLVRGMFFNRVIKKDAFPNAKTLKALNPEHGAETPDAARTRLEASLATFQDACRGRAASGQPVNHPVFGAVSVEAYARFMELHTIHHRGQLRVVA